MCVLHGRDSFVPRWPLVPKPNTEQVPDNCAEWLPSIAGSAVQAPAPHTKLTDDMSARRRRSLWVGARMWCLCVREVGSDHGLPQVGPAER